VFTASLIGVPVFFKTGSIGERILVRELVDQITRVAPQAEVGVVVGVSLDRTGAPTEAFTVTLLVVEQVAAIPRARGRAEGMQWDVGRPASAATAAAGDDVERNIGS